MLQPSVTKDLYLFESYIVYILDSLYLLFIISLKSYLERWCILYLSEWKNYLSYFCSFIVSWLQVIYKIFISVKISNYRKDILFYYGYIISFLKASIFPYNPKLLCCSFFLCNESITNILQWLEFLLVIENYPMQSEVALILFFYWPICSSLPGVQTSDLLILDFSFFRAFCDFLHDKIKKCSNKMTK